MTDNTQTAPSSAPKRKPAGVRTAVLVVLVMLAIFGYAGGVGLASLTLVPAWLPWTVGAVLALATGLWGRHLIGRMAGLRKVWLCYLIYVFVATGVFAAGLLLANRVGAGEREPVTAEVTRVYSEKRYRTKRVSRRSYTCGEPYNVYYAELDFGGGVRRPVAIDIRAYRRMHPGRFVEVALRRGRLGFKVVDPKGMHLVAPEKAEE